MAGSLISLTERYKEPDPTPFDPMGYGRKLDALVKSGELSWSLANAMWRNYAASVESVYPGVGKLPSPSLGYGSQLGLPRGAFGFRSFGFYDPMVAPPGAILKSDLAAGFPLSDFAG